MFAYNTFHEWDIVVWNGIICNFGSVKHLIANDEFLYQANEAEIIEYKNKREWK